MVYFMMAFVCAVIGIIPLVLRKKFGAAGWVFVTTLGFDAFFFWLFASHIVGPFFGSCSMAIFFNWLFSAIVDGAMESDLTWPAAFPLAFLLLSIIVIPLGSQMFRSSEFANMIGPFEERVWTQDIQPKSPQHIRLVNRENALFRAQNALKGDIGSQFEVSDNNLTLQMIKGKLWFVAPLDFRNYGAWSNSDGAPGYIKVSAEDDEQEPELVILPVGKKFHYTPEAYFNHQLERHIRLDGNINVGLNDFTLEVDDQDNPWWVITTYQPSILNTGERIVGVVIVNPTTGKMKPYDMDNIPAWVDRVVPDEFVTKYVGWWGEYKNGFINTLPILGSSKGRVKPLTPNLYYGSDDQPYWVTDVTSIGKDTSMVGLFYTNSRTGKSVFYKTDGGSTSSAIEAAVNSNQQVKYLHLHAGIPQLYNLYGTMASVTSLLNDQHARQGVAIVSVRDIQKVAVGNDIYEAIGKYQEIIGNHIKGALEKTRDTQTVTAVVERVHQEMIANGSPVHYIYLKGIPHVFYGTKKLSIKLPITERGDKVKLECASTEEAAVPIISFDNLSIVLKQSQAEKQVTEAAQKSQEVQRLQDNAETIRENLKNLSPEQLKELEKKLQSK